MKSSYAEINEAISMVIYNNGLLNIYLVYSQTKEAQVRNVKRWCFSFYLPHILLEILMLPTYHYFAHKFLVQQRSKNMKMHKEQQLPVLLLS